MNRTAKLVGLVLGVWIASRSIAAADWPTFQHDAARSGVTSESLEFPLAADWQFRPSQPPARGWGNPEETSVYNYGIRRIGKVRYDNAYHVAVVGPRAFFCASAENKVYCVDAATGEMRWTRYTDAAPRLAPTVANNRVYVGSDDGLVRCYDVDSGNLRWTFEARPGPDRVISQGRVHSLWPVRTSVLVQNDRAYFAAGLFPAEGLWLYSVDAAAGQLAWKQPFDDGGTANIAPQGYLLADAQRLILPAGRVSPSVFSLQDGSLLFGVQNGRALTGGTYCLLTDKYLYNGTQIISAYDLNNPVADRYGRKRLGTEVCGWFNARRLVARGDNLWLATADELLSIRGDKFAAACEQVDHVRELHWDHRNELNAYREAEERLKGLPAGSSQAGRYRQEMKRHQAVVEKLNAADAELDKYLTQTCRWRTKSEANESLILASGVLLAGGDNHVLAVDADRGKPLARLDVEGVARGLAVSGGRLFVSTTTGNINCFAPAAQPPQKPHQLVAPPVAEPYPDDAQTAQARVLADEILKILKSTEVRDGYCLLLGGSDGRLAYELAQHSQLSIYMLERDQNLVARAREALSRAGLYGSRVTVELVAGALPSYPPYFADLVVDQSALSGSPPGLSPQELVRMLKPQGGTAVTKIAAAGDATQRLKQAHVEVKRSADRTLLVRGPLPGGGSWTHQYGNAANTSNSHDTLANAPFRMLWFGDPGPEGIIDRHSAGAAPLSIGGRLFVQGSNSLRAYDAYNGRLLWRREMPRVGRTSMPDQSSNLVANLDSLFVVNIDRCLRLNARTGETVATYTLPPRTDGAKRLWGWVAVAGDTLFGSRTESDRAFRNWPVASGNTSEAVFAINLQDGSLRWIYEGQKIPHTALAATAKRVYLLDGKLSDAEKAQAEQEARQLGLAQAAPLDRRGQPRARELAKAVAVDAAKGNVIWSRPCDISDFVVYPRGGQPNVIAADDVVLLCGSPGGGDHYLKEFKAGEFARRSIIALSADSGKLLWAGGKNYINRPTIVGDLVYAEPWAYDLKTGKPHERQHPVTGQAEPWQLVRGAGGACGATSASANTLFFRSGTGAWYDLAADCGITRRGGQRLSCWINSITAGGLLLIPEGSAECDCPFAIQCTTVLYPDPSRPAWATLHFEGPLVPAQHLAVNLGAPGDTRSPNGTVWLSCPNQMQRYNWAGCRLDNSPQSGYFQLPAAEVPGTDNPQQYLTGARGVSEFSVPLTEKGKTARYTVKLGFLEPDAVEPGQRTFDVSLQGKPVLESFDVVRQAGGRRRAVEKTFPGVEVTGLLRVSLTPTKGAQVAAPILSSVEVIRE